MLAFSSDILIKNPVCCYGVTHSISKIKCVIWSLGKWYMILEADDPRYPDYSYSDLYDCVHPYLDKKKRYSSIAIEYCTEDHFCLPTFLLLKLGDEIEPI